METSLHECVLFAFSYIELDALRTGETDDVLAIKSQLETILGMPAEMVGKLHKAFM